MKHLASAERFFTIGHIFSMVFGLAGLLLVLPNSAAIASLPPFGQVAFRWSMAGGAVAYMVLGTIAATLYACRFLGLYRWLAFALPAVLLSLGSELLGTSVGFPFGHYAYLDNLGYKIAGLVPFTIPLSWFYLGFSAYILARAALEVRGGASWLRHLGAIAFGALLLTAWDFVLDPAMSQTNVRFWVWQQPGAFFGMPYQNIAGWLGTGAAFMTVAALLWEETPLGLDRGKLKVPLAIYLSNFAFSAVMSLSAHLWTPVILGSIVGAIPAIALWWMAEPERESEPPAENNVLPTPVEMAAK